jgi:hypothetical protein
MYLNYSSTKLNNFNLNISLGDKFLNLNLGKSCKILEFNQFKIFIEGELYYLNNSDQNYLNIFDINFENALFQIIKEKDITSLTKYLEGSYILCWFDSKKNEVGIVSDNLSRVKSYYIKIEDDFEMSTQLKDIINQSNGYDQHSLYSYILLGYTAEKDTFYSKIKRLASNEYFLISSNSVHKKKISDEPKNINNYSNNQIDNYDKIFTNSVSSRAGKHNIVMNSGGWDSTSILYKLCETQQTKKISTAVFDVILPNGQSYNKYEVDKVERIGKYFNVSTEKATVNYSDSKLLDYWESHLDNMKSNHMYFWLHHLKVSNIESLNINSGARIFNGECSDSIHNFGFSQFVSVNYKNMQLREMADKAKSYLYGPTFFEHIEEDTFYNDETFNFFHKYFGKDQFLNFKDVDRKTRVSNYFESFMLSGPRVPFAKWQHNELTHDKLRRNYLDHIRREYLEDAVTKCNSKTLYYWLLQMYKRFHFNSNQIGVTQVAMNLKNAHCVMPFLDTQLIDFMYKMPEDWGRGLELRTTKYPLRFLSEHKWKMPINILMEKGPHSYISEDDNRWSYAGGDWSIYCEIMYKSVFKNYFKKIFTDIKLEDIFDPSYFQIEKIKLIIKNYINDIENPKDVNILFRLAILFSIGLY